MPQESSSTFRQQLEITWNDDGGHKITGVETKMVLHTNLGNSEEEITNYNTTDDASNFDTNSFTKFLTPGVSSPHSDPKDIWLGLAPRHPNHPAEWYTEMVWTVRIFSLSSFWASPSSGEKRIQLYTGPDSAPGS